MSNATKRIFAMTTVLMSFLAGACQTSPTSGNASPTSMATGTGTGTGITASDIGGYLTWFSSWSHAKDAFDKRAALTATRVAQLRAS